MSLKVGLTGGIGCGKSTALRRFAELGVPVMDADDCVREVQEPGTPAYKAIVEAFGASCVAADDRLDRARLRSMVFKDEAARRTLEAIVHPAVREAISAWCARQTASYCVVAIPLLIESGDYAFLDRVVVVDCEPAQQIARVAARSQLSPGEVEAIMRSQATPAQRRAAADYILDNRGDETALCRQVDELHAVLRQSPPSPAVI